MSFRRRNKKEKKSSGSKGDKKARDSEKKEGEDNPGLPSSSEDYISQLHRINKELQADIIATKEKNQEIKDDFAKLKQDHDGYKKTTLIEFERKIKELRGINMKLSSQVEGSTQTFIMMKEEYEEKINALKTCIMSEKEGLTEMQTKYNSLMGPRFDSVLVNEEKCYDYVFLVERIGDGFEGGWKIFDYKGDVFEKPKIDRSVITMVCIGFFGAGKSYIHSKISKAELPMGAVVHTRGISVKSIELEGSDVRKYILDVAGFQTPVILKMNSRPSSPRKDQSNQDKKYNNDILLNKKRNEEFIYRLALRISSIFIVVVSQMTLLQQLMIEEVKFEISNSSSHEMKRMFVIHNLKEIQTKEEMEILIEEECAKLYDGKILKQTFDGVVMKMFQEVKRNKNSPDVLHFFLGKEGTPAGENNEAVFSFFRHLEKVVVCKLQKRNFFDRVKDEIDVLLPKFVKDVPENPIVLERSKPLTSAELKDQDGGRPGNVGAKNESSTSNKKKVEDRECQVEDEVGEEEEDGEDEDYPNDDETKNENDEDILVDERDELGGEEVIPGLVGRLKFGIRNGSGTSGELKYKWDPNISFGAGVIGRMSPNDFRSECDILKKKVGSGTVFKIIFDAPGLQEIKRVKWTDEFKFPEKLEVEVTYGLWKISRRLRKLKIKLLRVTAIEGDGDVGAYGRQERNGGDFCEEILIPTDVDIPSRWGEDMIEKTVECVNGTVTFQFDEICDEEE